MDERYENELQHWGIKGMKWGVRRYQNDDGSLTAAGRVRYGAGKARDKIGSAVKAGVQRHKAKVAAKKEEKRIEELMKKPIRKLSEAELRERAARANNESVLKQIEERNKQAAMSFVAKFGSKLVNEAAVPAIVTAGKNIATKFLEKTLSKSLGLDAEDLTNTYELFKKAGFDINKLTDKQVAALATRQDGAKKLAGNSDSEPDGNILAELAAVGGDVTRFTDSQMSRLGKYSEALGKYNKVKSKDSRTEEEEAERRESGDSNGQQRQQSQQRQQGQQNRGSNGNSPINDSNKNGDPNQVYGYKNDSGNDHKNNRQDQDSEERKKKKK